MATALVKWLRKDYSPYHTATFQRHFSWSRHEIDDYPEHIPGPLTLFWYDIKVITSNLPLLKDILKPYHAPRKTDELYLWPPEGLPTIWLLFWSIVQLPIALFFVLISLAGILSVQILSDLYARTFWHIIQGPMLQVYPPELPEKYNPRYRWIFINGIMVDKEGLAAELEILSTTFNAPVLGVHNRTYGLVGDLVECVFQRAFGWQTLETRIAEPIIKKYLNDVERVDKVILVAHSQGGIIASDILNVIYAEVPWAQIHGRLEVYTFGSAARCFKNPWLNGHRTERVIKNMEHYCHKEDFVTRYGALASLEHSDTDEIYMGRIFVAEHHTGHLLNQHYLANMFPGPRSKFLAQRTEQDHQRGKEHVFKVYISDARGKLVRDLSYLSWYLTHTGSESIENGA